MNRWYGFAGAVVSAVAFVALLELAGSTARAEEPSPKVTLTIEQVPWERQLFPISDFNESHSGVAVEAVTMNRSASQDGEDSRPKTLDEVCDIVFVYISPCADDLQHLVDKNLLQSLNGMLEQAQISPSAFPEAAMEAVTYSGRIWAVPYELSFAFLSYDKVAFRELSIDPHFDSWEGLYEAAAKIAAARTDAQDPLDGFVVPWPTMLSHCEYMVLTSGGNVFSMTDPSYLKSADLRKAYQLTQKYEAAGVIRRKQHIFGALAKAGIWYDISSTANSSDAIGILDPPKRLFKTDALREGYARRADLLALAFKRNTPAKQQAVVEFLEWLLSEQTQLRMVQLSDLTNPVRMIQTGGYCSLETQRTLQYTHIPVMKSVLESGQFKSAAAANPDYAALLRLARTHQVGRREPASLYLKAFELASKTVDVDTSAQGLEKALDNAYRAVVELAAKTPIQSTEFDKYK